MPTATEISQLINKQNELINKWVPKVRRNLKTNAKKFVNGKTKSMVQRPGRSEEKLAASINTRTYKKYGIIEGVSFRFERHGVYILIGSGRKHKASVNPRETTDWLNPTLDQYLPELADSIAEINTEVVVNATRMRIK